MTNKTNMHNTFSVTDIINMSDGKTREVTVLGVRGEKVKNDINQTTVEYGKTIESHIILTKNKVRTFDVVYTIKNPDDNSDINVMLKILNCRLKKGNVHLHLETPQYFGSEMCKLIVQNELKYIVDHIDEFINKL